MLIDFNFKIFITSKHKKLNHIFLISRTLYQSFFYIQLFKLVSPILFYSKLRKTRG